MEQYSKIAIRKKLLEIKCRPAEYRMYEDETGCVKGEVQRRKIVETEIFSVDECISIISEIFAIVEKKETDIK